MSTTVYPVVKEDGWVVVVDLTAAGTFLSGLIECTGRGEWCVTDTAPVAGVLSNDIGHNARQSKPFFVGDNMFLCVKTNSSNPVEFIVTPDLQ